MKRVQLTKFLCEDSLQKVKMKHEDLLERWITSMIRKREKKKIKTGCFCNNAGKNMSGCLQFGLAV